MKDKFGYLEELCSGNPLYRDRYLELLSRSIGNRPEGYTEVHHMVPCSYLKNFGISRGDMECDENNLVTISPVSHILSHRYILLSANDSARKYMNVAYRGMCGMAGVNPDVADDDEFIAQLTPEAVHTYIRCRYKQVYGKKASGFAGVMTDTATMKQVLCRKNRLGPDEFEVFRQLSQCDIVKICHGKTEAYVAMPCIGYKPGKNRRFPPLEQIKIFTQVIKEGYHVWEIAGL